MTDKQEYDLGWRKYAAGLAEEACTSAAQRAGRRAANSAQGYAEATAYLAGVQ